MSHPSELYTGYNTDGSVARINGETFAEVCGPFDDRRCSWQVQGALRQGRIPAWETVCQLKILEAGGYPHSTIALQALRETFPINVNGAAA